MSKMRSITSGEESRSAGRGCANDDGRSDAGAEVEDKKPGEVAAAETRGGE